MDAERCSVCGKGFGGWEPLSDGRGNLFHRKCAPKPDVAGMMGATLEALGAESVEFVDGDGRRRGGFGKRRRK